MKWEQLLSTKRSRGGTKSDGNKVTDLRSEFEKDYHRIIGSASFRRLQDKTQVFPLDKSDFIRTRLTHSLEVSSFAKSLGQNIGQYILDEIKDPEFTWQTKEDICNIVQCAGLIHDIGNPPFGHFGETAIREWFKRNLSVIKFGERRLEECFTEQMKADFYNFEGNAQALRLVSKLHFLVDEQGMNLTYALLNTIVKYPVSSIEILKTKEDIKSKKMGYYAADEDVFAEIRKETGTLHNRHPLTFILEAADDIAYKTADIEDAFKKGMVSFHGLQEALQEITGDKESRFDAYEVLKKQYKTAKEKGLSNPEQFAVQNWVVRVQGHLIYCATYGFTKNYSKIMEGTYKYDLFHDTFGEKLMKVLGDVAYNNVFTSEAIYKMEMSEAVMIDFLMDKFMDAAIKYETQIPSSSIDERVMALISDNYKNAYHHRKKGKSEEEMLYLRLLLVTDYICGMTDSYAKRLYQELNALI